MAKRVHGVLGVQQAHEKAAQISETDFFFIVDGDNRVKEDFAFETPVEKLDFNTLYVWRCYNPAIDLSYGYGAIKLYNKSLVANRRQILDQNRLDLATSVADNYHIVHKVASETWFFTSPFEAWRGAFRETVKLTSQVLRNSQDQESQMRLEAWCKRPNKKPMGEWIVRGAEQGREFATDNREQIHLINDFAWLHRYFNGNES